MSRGSRNIHALAGTLRRLENEALDGGPCKLHPDRASVGYIADWRGIPNRVCQACADYGVEHGYTFTARLSEPFNHENDGSGQRQQPTTGEGDDVGS